MEECSAFCCADEQCNVAFLIRDNCFLVACKDYDSCKMKPALSEYYRPRMAYVNWSPPDDEIPGTFFQGYVWLICTDEQRHNFLWHKAYRGKKENTESSQSRYLLSFWKTKTFCFASFESKKMVQFCYLEQYFCFENVLCRLLQRMARMDMDWNPTFSGFYAIPANSLKKLWWLVFLGEICVITTS